MLERTCTDDRLEGDVMSEPGRGLSSDICTTCNGSGMDATWHEGATVAERHACGYCQGGTYSGRLLGPRDARDDEPYRRAPW